VQVGDNLAVQAGELDRVHKPVSKHPRKERPEDKRLQVHQDWKTVLRIISLRSQTFKASTGRATMQLEVMVSLINEFEQGAKGCEV
jgi:hypothetical protein